MVSSASTSGRELGEEHRQLFGRRLEAINVQYHRPFQRIAISWGASRLSTVHSFDQSRSPTGRSSSSFGAPADKNLDTVLTALFLI